MEIKEEKKFTPISKKVVIKPIMRDRGLVSDPKHEAYFLFGESKIKYSLPKDKNGNFINPFRSEAEKLWLEKALDADLNIYKRTDNYFTRKESKVILGKNSRTIDLANPNHYLEYLILLANKDFIAPSGAEQMFKKSYRYALVEEQFETEKKVSNLEIKKKAYRALDKLQESREGMIKFLKVYGLNVSEHSKEDFLASKLDEIIENDIKGFLALAEDSNFDVKLLIEEAVACGAIIKNRREYSLPGGNKLAFNGLNATLDNVIKFLAEPENKDILDTINARVDAAKDN